MEDGTMHAAETQDLKMEFSSLLDRNNEDAPAPPVDNDVLKCGPETMTCLKREVGIECGHKCFCEESYKLLRGMSSMIKELQQSQQIVMKKVIHIEYLMPLENIPKCFNKILDGESSEVPKPNQPVDEVEKTYIPIFNMESSDSDNHPKETRGHNDLFEKTPLPPITEHPDNLYYEAKWGRVVEEPAEKKSRVLKAAPLMINVVKDKQGPNAHVGSDLVGKKLSFTPSPDYLVGGKGANSDPPTKLTPMKRTSSFVRCPPCDTNVGAKSIATDGRATSRKGKGQAVPKCIKTKFKPTMDMKLTDEEAKLSAYVFYHDNNPNEVIFKCRDVIGTMKDFDTLCPDRTIETEIYVPIQEAGGHWYLAVISVSQKMVYHLDSYLDEKCVNTRRFHIEKVCEYLSGMIGSDVYPPNFGNAFIDLDKWEICHPRVTDKSGNWYNSAVWIIDWMKMEESFQPNLFGAINEKLVKMKVAMDLLCGEHNDCWETLQAKVETFWRMAI
ncbi:Ulp1 protease family, C-terminal catalytic domain [Sesbania bispinosa]|nr:Ulp1 protease family, C-terminal catalytic domain [Sesbania bispinosa]